MATLEDVRRIATGLPEVTEGTTFGMLAWKVKDKAFVWERPLRRADLEALGSAAPTGAVLGARVEHLGIKDALLAENPNMLFTTPHFDGYAAVLVRLDRIDLPELEELVVEAWLSRAPKRIATAYLQQNRASR